jgi:lipopolysaccharide export system permease protein
MRITLYRYLIKEQLIPFSLCLLGATTVLITGRLLQLTLYLFTSSISALDLLKLIAFAMPNLILYAIPMAALLATLLAFVRLNGDNELVILRASGTSFLQLLPPVLLMLVLSTFLSFYNALHVVPSANYAFENKIKSLGRAGLPLLLKEGTFIDIIPNLTFFFHSVDASALSMRGIFVQDQREPRIRMAIVAEHAEIINQSDSNQLTFKMSNGIITRVADNLKDAQSVYFRMYDLTLSLDEIFAASTSSPKGRKEMTLWELHQAIAEGGQDVDISLPLEFHRRLSLPSACFFLGLVGAPLGALFRRQSRMAGITMALGIFVTYYIILSAGKGFGENRLVSPFLSVWTANIFSLLLAVYLWTKVHRETPFRLAKVWTRFKVKLPSIHTLLLMRKKHSA